MRKITAHLKKPGTWEAKGIHPGTNRRKSYYASTKELAEKLAHNSYETPTSNTLYDFYAHAYLPTIVKRAYGTKKHIGWLMDKHVLPAFGDKELSEITRKDVQAFFNASTLSANTLPSVKAYFSAVMSLAVLDEVIDKNPVSSVRLPDTTKVEKTALNLVQLRTLIENSPPSLKPAVILTGCCGLRIGEALGVTRAAIDKDGILTVSQQVQQRKGGPVVVPQLKTPESYRRIPLPSGLRSALLVSDSLWVCNDGASFAKPVTVAWQLKELCPKIGIPVVSPHELRHTFVTLIERVLEAPRPVVRSLIGHADKDMTDSYSHTQIAQQRKWMERLWLQVSTASTTKVRQTGS